MFMKRVSASAIFSPEKMAKSPLAQGEFLFAGLNCFEAGQEHPLHSHEGQDKLYLVLEGKGVARVGEEAELLSAGDAAFAPAGVAHSIRNEGPGRLVVMTVMGPPPAAKS
jgi:quercetin dioxygenase-like cupin family protein